jgi:hypothetical protein
MAEPLLAKEFVLRLDLKRAVADDNKVSNRDNLLSLTLTTAALAASGDALSAVLATSSLFLNIGLPLKA